MRKLTFFLAAVSLVLFAEKALCRETSPSIEPESLNSLKYEEIREIGPVEQSITTGRFLSVDPGKDWDPSKPQSWNMYAYVRNNPINVTDPNGRCAQEAGKPPCSDMEVVVTAKAPTLMEELDYVMSLAWITPEGRGEVAPQESGSHFKLQVLPVGVGSLGLRGGAMRAAQHGANWQGVSLSETITNIAGKNPVIGRTGQKVIYTNPDTGMRVIHDIGGNYFRVQNAAGKYVDQFGKPIPANVPLVNSKAKEVGVWRWLREALTHFRNTD